MYWGGGVGEGEEGNHNLSDFIYNTKLLTTLRAQCKSGKDEMHYGEKREERKRGVIVRPWKPNGFVWK